MPYSARNSKVKVIGTILKTAPNVIKVPIRIESGGKRVSFGTLNTINWGNMTTYVATAR